MTISTAQSDAASSTLPRNVDVLIIGAGQAGLGTAHWLEQHPGVTTLVVEAGEIGSSWVDRWDSLQLFTPRRFSGLPGLPFPRGKGRTPSRLEMAAYLRSYAATVGEAVRTGVEVTRLARDGAGFVAETTDGVVHAGQVVVATGPFHSPFVPEAARGLSSSVHQLHSVEYRRPGDVPPGDVLVVGGGNSAAQLAIELSDTHRVTIASPGPLWFLPEDLLGVSLYWWSLLTGILNARTDAWISRSIRRRGDAIVGYELRRLVRRGTVRLCPSRVVTGDGTQLVLADGTVEHVSSVLWCTGFLPTTGWIDVPGALDERGAPLHDRGASPVRGLHWMGLPWQTRLNSSIIDGVDRDARATVRRIAAIRAGASATPPS